MSGLLDVGMTDGELARAARAGDSASLGVLLERHRAPLYAIALHLLGHRPDAQDAVHDTFLVALRQLHQIRDPEAVGGWLRKVLYNVCRMRLRMDQGEVLFEELPPDLESRTAEPSAEEAIDRLALRDWVWTALATLPEVLRVTAMLRYFGTHASYAEIAAILGVPIGTVRSRLNQAKTRLGEALLETAALAHDEAQVVTAARARHFAAAVDEINHGRGYDLFVAGFSADPVLALPGGRVLHGRAPLVADLESDLLAGTKLRLTKVFASKDVAILEATFENPPDNPNRCPPAITQVHVQRDGLTQRLHLYFADHLNPDDPWSPNKPPPEEITL